eukprot:scaffold21169_cov51-Attheya_sp.AAC.3
MIHSIFVVVVRSRSIFFLAVLLMVLFHTSYISAGAIVVPLTESRNSRKGNGIQVILKGVRRVAVGAFVAGSLVLAPKNVAAAATEDHIWQLSNGEVRLTDPLPHIIEKQQNPLREPRLLGSGGGGAVFSFADSNTVVKVSWLRSAASVEKECATLQFLELKSVPGVERCLGQVRYPDDPRRVMIAMQPLVSDEAVSSLAEIDTSLQPQAVRDIVRTLVQMLAAQVVTVDVQPLISKQTGNVLFIDMTEAQILSPPLSFLDKALVSSFCTEMLSLIPDRLLPGVSKLVKEEIQNLELKGIRLSSEVYDVLTSQTL